MKLTILGSGTAVPSKERSAPAYLLEAADKLILLDSGEGTKKRVVEADKNLLDIDYIFYTHTHVDHVAELPAILWGYNWVAQPRTKTLEIYGPKGFKQFFNKMTDAFWPQFKKNAKYKVEIIELKNKKVEFNNFAIQTYSLDEQGNTLVPQSIGYRIVHKNKIFVYTGDVGYNEDVVKLARNADVLLIESAVPKADSGHLTPRQAGELASLAKVKKVILTHFYPEVEQINIIKEAKKSFGGKMILAKDLMEITI